MFASEYTRADLERVRSLCLTIAIVLGDEICSNDVVVVGGIVPSLLFEGVAQQPDLGAHVGTSDLDLALDIVILDEHRYEAVRDRLIRGGFENDTKEDGTIVRQRWRSAKTGAEVDFLMPLDPPSGSGGGRLQESHARLCGYQNAGTRSCFGPQDNDIYRGTRPRWPACRARSPRMPR
ncbi:MAG: hypothetical protein JWM87_3904 [Candidatus Eremiobacteraeota bacterium]|nr:hypothetical protein [Candidatus Eremiobacteraeota bacterium]